MAKQKMDVQGSYYSQNNAGEVRTAGYMPGVPATKTGAASSTSFRQALSETSAAQNAAQAPQEEGGFMAFLKGILDVINPLQHIPVVSAIYRHLTGDEISPMARIAGDALYGGPLGGALAMADVAVEKVTGRDVGETVIAMVAPGKGGGGTMLAQNFNALQPAAGSDIIWNTPAPAIALAQNNIQQNLQQDPLSHTPRLPYSKGTIGNDPASTSYARPGHPSEGNPPATSRLTAAQGNAGSGRVPAASEAGSGIAAQTQEAPADVARNAPLPGPIASSLQPVNVTAEIRAQESTLTADEEELNIVAPVSKDLIAHRMAEALDKYQAMKKDGMRALR